jgi:hypothetical protein
MKSEDKRGDSLEGIEVEGLILRIELQWTLV